MSGVEIEFSVEDGETSAQDDEGNENEASDSRSQASTTTGRHSRIQGFRHYKSSMQDTEVHD